MSKSIALGLLCAGAILLAILLTGCSDAPSPTPSAEAVPSPTVTAQPGVMPEPTPTPTMAPTNTPTPEPTPAAATLSLYEYLTQCAPPEQELADDATYGDVSVLAAELIQRLEAMVPPADLVEWHHLYIELFRTVQAMHDRFPKDDVIDNAKMDEFLLAVAPDLEEKYSDLEEKLSEVAVRLPEHLRQQMIEVDCLDPDIVPDDYDEPDDHGNNFESATRIAIGEAVAIELEFRLDKDVLVFLAEPGTEYEFTLDWESYSRLRHTARPILALFDAGGQEFARLNHYVFGSQDKMMWQAVTRGDYYIVVGDTVTDGSITLTVTDGEATEQLDRDDATVAPTHTSTPVPTPAAATLSLDEYLTLCATTEQDLADDATFGDFSSLFAAEADRLEALTPPVQLSEWHLLNIENFRTIQAFVELQPKDDVIDVARFFLMAAISADSEEKLRAAAARLPEDVRQQMIEAGCTDPEDVLDDHEDVPDDHGDDIDDATAIRVGADVRGAMDYDGDIDFFRFQAERGQSYQIDVALGTLDDSIVELYDVDWSFLDTNDDYGDTYASRLYWEAPSSGERYVAVYGYGTGTYTLTVSLVDDHGDTAEDGVGVASDRAALVALYNATEGGSWTTRTNWLSGRPLDEWHGVTTDGGGRVTELNLSSNSLYGALPAELGDLTNLESLRLSDNPLTGPIPAELGDLTNLRALNLGSNGRGRLTGPIPAALGDLTNLESLVLSNNELTGPIPAALGDLTNLRALNLWSNELTGPIPAALGDLTNLESLNLGWNELTGPIPAWLGDLTNLIELVLSFNQLTGRIPAELGDLSNLESLNLGWNQLTGPIPAWLGDLTNLEFLDLGTNRLTGPIPAELSNLSNLKVLQLLGNQLTGCVPVGLRDVAEENDLGELELPDCGLEGRPTAGSFVSVSAGWSHTCGVRRDGSVACWGEDEHGQAAPLAGSFVSVSAGQWHTCGLRSDGSVACWGRDDDGQATPPAGSFDSVRAGQWHTCGVRSNGAVACWGFDFDGQATPTAGSFDSVSAGWSHTCGVRSDGSVACWGSNWNGEATPPAGSFDSVSAGNEHTCGVRSNGSVACWGEDEDGQATPPAGSFDSVSAGWSHTCGVRSNGSVACWGRNLNGEAAPPAGSFDSVSAGGGTHLRG